MTLLNCILLGLSVIGAARVALRERSPGWWLLVAAFCTIYAHGTADRDAVPTMGPQMATLANVLLLLGLLLIYHGHRETIQSTRSDSARREAELRMEVHETIQRLDRAQRQLAGHEK